MPASSQSPAHQLLSGRATDRRAGADGTSGNRALYFAYADHLGNITALSWTGGTTVTGEGRPRPTTRRPRLTHRVDPAVGLLHQLHIVLPDQRLVGVAGIDQYTSDTPASTA